MLDFAADQKIYAQIKAVSVIQDGKHRLHEPALVLPLSSTRTFKKLVVVDITGFGV
jgi:hypothetical protein